MGSPWAQTVVCRVEGGKTVIYANDELLDNLPLSELPDLELYGMADRGDAKAEAELRRRGLS